MEGLVMNLIWLLVIVGAAIVEAATVQLVSTWFVAGGAAALIGSLCSLSIFWQCVLFFGMTLLTLLVTRPLVKKATNFEKTPTGVDRYIGQTGEVIATIENLTGGGIVVVLGSTWTAKSEDGNTIEKGSKVKVERIEGVKLIVSAL